MKPTAKAPDPLQLPLVLAALDFPDRTTVLSGEIAPRLGVSEQHIIDHIESGTLTAVDTALVKTRANRRIPIGEYRRWLLAHLTGPAQETFIAELPDATAREVWRQLCARFGAAA